MVASAIPATARRTDGSTPAGMRADAGAGVGRDMEALRRWGARARRSVDAQRTPHVSPARLALWRLALGHPRECLEAVRAYGPSPRGHALAVVEHLAKAWWLRTRYDLAPTAFYRFQLYRAERWRQRALWVGGAQSAQLVRWAVRQGPPRAASGFSDKARFAAWCRAHAVPCVGTVGVVDASGGPGAGLDASALPPGPLFSKPTRSQAGHGARRWRALEAGRWCGDDGRTVDGEGLLATLAEQSAELGRPILVQPLLANHPALASLSRGGLATLRMVTLRVPGERSEVLAGILRLPAGDSPTDNFETGGLAADVAMATGRVDAAVQKSAATVEVRHRVHPDTGGVIDGAVVPHWGAVLALVQRVHDALPDDMPPLLGWDVAVTETGPVVVEGNDVPCTLGLQMVTGCPLGGTRYPAAMLAYLDRRVGSGQAPGGRAHAGTP